MTQEVVGFGSVQPYLHGRGGPPWWWSLFVKVTAGGGLAICMTIRRRY